MKVRLVTTEGYFITQLSFEQASDLLHEGQARVYALYPYTIQVKRSDFDQSACELNQVFVPEPSPMSAKKVLPLVCC
jgi:hypothetical protein